MRTRVCAVMCCGWMFCVAPALADSDSGTVVAIPGRPDVPVIVNPYGFDASYAIIEGDFGLNKPAQNNTQIIVGSPLSPLVPARRFYFPHADSAPAYGRFEAPPAGGRVTQTPQSYNRSWGAASDPLPASTDPAYPMTISPFVGPWGPGRGRRHDHGWGHHGGRR
jgi:hypothetical protein